MAPPTLSYSPQAVPPPNPLTIWVDRESGLRLSPGCAHGKPTTRRVALWPPQLEPWLPAPLRRAALLPPWSPSCTAVDPGQRIVITGIADGSRLARAGPQASPPRIALSAIGGQGMRYWYLNGRLRWKTQPGEIRHVDLSEMGKVEITVIDQAGHVDRRGITLGRTAY